MSFILKNITNDAGEKKSINNLNATINSDRLILLAGDKTSGKQMLLKIVGGMLPPDKGTIHYNDLNLYPYNLEEMRAVRSRISFVFQNGGLLANLNIHENLRLPLDFLKPELTDTEKEKIISNYMDKFQLFNILEKRPSELTLDVIKQVGFVRALSTGPEVLVMNEPVSDCEVTGVRNIINEITALKKEKKGIIMINQTSNEFLNMADQILIMKQGMIVDSGTYSELRTNYNFAGNNTETTGDYV